jgi:hypothetical protein
MRIELRIGRLVLDEALIDRHQAEDVASALRVELSRLLAARPAGSWQASRRLRGVVAPRMRAGAAGDPSGLGRDLAGSVAAGISQATQTSTRGGGRR